MRRERYTRRVFVWFLILAAVWPASLAAQGTWERTEAEQRYTYSQQQLDELLAPIALYPDSLLSQILMASTYPLEVVQANRWLKQNPDLTGERLDEALKEKPWDVSVKSLCHYPQVLAMMDEKLDVTTDLGNAFLGQQDEVMDTIQKLRARAYAEGNLQPTEQQKVIVEESNIIIEPPHPNVIYVPAYNPCWVYGPWWYPVCSPLWFWYPRIVVGIGFYWGPRIFVGPWSSWCGFSWARRSIFVNVNRTAFFHKPSPTRMHGGVERWRHNPVHRRGVAYRDSVTAQRFGRVGVPGSETRQTFRGFERGAEEGPRAPRPPERGPGRPERADETRPDMRPQPRPEARPEASPGVRPEPRPGSRPDVRPEPRTRTEPREFERQGVQPRGVPPAEPRVGSPRPAPDQPPGGRAFQGFGRGGIESQQQSERGRQSMGVPPGRGGPPVGRSPGMEGLGRPEGRGGARPGGDGRGPGGGVSGGGRTGGGRPGK